jgi:WD40 repeat protein
MDIFFHNAFKQLIAMGNDLKKEATCTACLKILNKPVLLPCQCSSICHEHIDELIRVKKENSLTCQQCYKTFDLKNEKFAENQSLNNKIKSMEYLSSRERQSFAFIQNNLEQMEKFLNDYEEKLNEFTMVVVDHFYDIKNAIDIRRETLLEEIQNKNKNVDHYGERLAQESNELIERTEQAEETFLRIFNLKVKSNIDEVNLEHERNRILEFFRNPKLIKEDLENLENDFNFKFDSLSGILERFDSFQMLLAQNYFKPYVDKRSLGELFININDVLNVILANKYSKRIEIYNLLTGKLIYNLTGHTNRLTGLSLYGQNKFVSGSEDNAIKFWDLQTAKCLKTLDVYSVNCLKVLKNGNLATGSDRNSIIIWDMFMFKLKFTLFSHRGKGITCLEQLSNEWLVSGGILNETIEIWDLIKRVCVRVIYSCYSIDLHDKALFRTYFREAGRVTCLKGFEMKIDDKIECFFASGSSSGFLGIWNASNGACVKEIRIFMPSEICSLEIRSNEELLCSYINHSRNGSFYSHGVSLIDLRTFEQSKLDYQKNYILEAKYGNEISKQIGKISRDSEDFVEIYTAL